MRSNGKISIKKINMRTIQGKFSIILMLVVYAIIEFGDGAWEISRGVEWGIALVLLGIELFYFATFFLGKGEYRSYPSLILIYILLSSNDYCRAYTASAAMLIAVQGAEVLMFLIRRIIYGAGHGWDTVQDEQLLHVFSGLAFGAGAYINVALRCSY